eukprot:3774003-Pleurochrysis_carterae.AAC.5
MTAAVTDCVSPRVQTPSVLTGLRVGGSYGQDEYDGQLATVSTLHPQTEREPALHRSISQYGVLRPWMAPRTAVKAAQRL